jgi:hypothetical protein
LFGETIFGVPIWPIFFKPQLDPTSAAQTPAQSQGDFKGPPWLLPDSVLNQNYRKDVTLTKKQNPASQFKKWGL